MKAGAVDFIQKPFRDQELIDRVHSALDEDREKREESAARSEINDRIKALTSREFEVMGLVVEGKPNKEVAFDLGLSPRTVEIHRARVMQKMRAGSLADLVRMALRVRR